MLGNRFVVDSMLEKLARYLRCCGADAVSDRSASTATLVERANREGRWFLTRNSHLEHHALLPDRLLRLVSEDAVVQVHEVVDAGLLDFEAMFSRCIRCNEPLRELERGQARGLVPERVFEAHQHFFACPTCHTVFWRGSHVRNTCRKLGLPDASEGR